MTHIDDERILATVARVLARWRRDGWLGEIVIIVGENGDQIEQRPIFKDKFMKRERRGSVTIETVTEN